MHGHPKQRASSMARRDFLKTSGILLSIPIAARKRAIAVERKDIIVIRSGQVIDGTGKEPLRNTSIIIENGRFNEITKGNVKAPSEAIVIDAAGKTVLPGLIDMHAHLLSGGFDT